MTRTSGEHVDCTRLKCNEDFCMFLYLHHSGDDNSLREHNWKAHSMSPVNLAEIEILEASEFDLFLIQLHGRYGFINSYLRRNRAHWIPTPSVLRASSLVPARSRTSRLQKSLRNEGRRVRNQDCMLGFPWKN